MKENILIDTMSDYYSDESYAEYLRDNGYAEDEVEEKLNDESFWDWQVDMMESDKDSFMEYIRDTEEYQIPAIITGSLGLWDGRKEIYPVIKDTLFDAITRCVEYADGYKVTECDGVFKVYVYHHDGTNIFEIKALSNSGLKKWHDMQFDTMFNGYTEKDSKRFAVVQA